MLRALPMGEVAIGSGVPVGGQLVAAEQPRCPTLCSDGAGVHEGVDADVVGLRHGDGVAGTARRRAERLEPVDAEAGFRIVARGFLARDLVACPVDERDRRAHGHRRVVRLQHPGASGEDAHAGTEGRLRHVHRSDPAGADMLQRRRQLGPQPRHEVAPGDGRRVRRTLAAHQHDG